MKKNSFYLFIVLVLLVSTLFINQVDNQYSHYIIYQLRIPKFLLLFIVGGILAMTGMVYQAFFQNDLTTPYTLGVASASSLGAVIGLFVGSQFIFIYALLFSLILTFLIYKMLVFLPKIGLKGLVLAGVAVNLFCSSFIVLFQYLSSPMESIKMIHWLMGSIDVVGFESLLIVVPFSLIVFYYFFKNKEMIHMLLIGHDLAHTKGVEIKKLQRNLLFISSLGVAGVTSECGPISFVGIIIPFFVKLIYGQNLKKNLFDAFIIGGVFLLICNLIIMSVFNNTFPIGIVTSIIGGPIFIYSLIRKN